MLILGFNCIKKKMEQKIEIVLPLLCSDMKLERDKGIIELEKALPALNFPKKQELQKKLVELLSNPQNSWQIRHGSLLCAKSLISYLNVEDEADSHFLLTIQQISQRLLTDVECRVRLAAGEVLGRLCKTIGTEVYQDSKEIILKLIQSNLERNFPENDSSKLEQFETGILVEKLVRGCDKREIDAAHHFQFTAGWKNLETSLKALESMIEGCGMNFQPFVDEELLSLIFKTLTHANQFVRECGFHVCSSLFKCGETNNESDFVENITAINPIFLFGNEFSKHLAKGLAEDWPQVCLSASVATRNFLQSLPNDESRQLFYPQLLPRMCLNRYYAADGVRNYSQETWKLVFGAAGTELVEQHIESTVQYYIEATLSDKHAVREAACACIAELASKISKDSIRPYVNVLLNTLLNCFQDKSWAVRDAACLACGNFIFCFPNESNFAMDSLFPMFYRNLSDLIPSVRQGAATALASVVKAYGEGALENVMAHIRHNLGNIKKQESEPDNYEILSKKLKKDGSYGRIKDPDIPLHSGKETFNSNSRLLDLEDSCGRENSFQRECQPWESADGCLYLIGELSSIKEIHKEIISLVPLIKEAGGYRHYDNHVVFLETICKQIPLLAKNLGKKVFKSIVEEFFDILFYSLDCDSPLTSSAASQCLTNIATFLGPNLLLGKLNNFNVNYKRRFESVFQGSLV